MVGFWIFMLIMVLLIPGTMLGFGMRFMKKAPNNINLVFGYRTTRSIKNKNTWDFAHKYIGKLWKILALIMLPLSFIPLLFVFGSDVDTVGTVGGIIVMIQLIPMVAAIFPTEHALKKNFDEFGRKRRAITSKSTLSHQKKPNAKAFGILLFTSSLFTVTYSHTCRLDGFW